MNLIKKIFFCAVLLPITIVFCAQPSLLIKMPTRGRPHAFFRTLDRFYQKLSFTVPYHFVISCDLDDPTMNNSIIKKRLETYPHLTYVFEEHPSKIAAHNSGLEHEEGDIILAVHDDMEPVIKGYDRIIVDMMMQEFPDLDGVLNFNDGFVGGQCNTLPIMGKAYYQRWGYLYHPSYQALVANVELTNVSKILKKERVIDQVIIRHNHPAWGAGSTDSIYEKSEQHHATDLQNFIERRNRFFDLSEKYIQAATPKLWSILICTLDEREESFNRLCQKLKHQIKKLGLDNEIEILSCKDKRGEHTVGYKRNKLLAESSGAYISYLDDDDDVHENYIHIIYEKLLKTPDCVSLTGIITTNGHNPKTFIHSRMYQEYSENETTYFRPPNHLNPIKRAIAAQFSFPEKNFGEDTEWALAIARSHLIKTEEVITTPYYFYQYVTK